MQPPVAGGLMLTAGALGLTHGIEPDHVAGITALTHEGGDTRLSALVGGCFATGHVVLVVVWIASAKLLVGATSFPGVYDRIGRLIIGIALAVLGLYLGVTGTRTLVRRYRQTHDERSHTTDHVPLVGQIGHGTASYGRSGAITYLTIGTIGASFTLSPPVSMIAFVSVTMVEERPALLTGVVAAYTATIVVSMAAVGGGTGTFFRITKTRGERVHAIARITAATLILAAAVTLLPGVPHQVPALHF